MLYPFSQTVEGFAHSLMSATSQMRVPDGRLIIFTSQHSKKLFRWVSLSDFAVAELYTAGKGIQRAWGLANI